MSAIILIIIIIILFVLCAATMLWKVGTQFKEHFSHDADDDRIFIDNRLKVKTSNIQGAGFGVFAIADIPIDTVIEKSHGIVINKKDRRGEITNYDFTLSSGDTFIALGYGCIYNHSKMPNVQHEMETNQLIMQYRTLRDIRAGEELYVSYGDSWFEVRGIDIK